MARYKTTQGQFKAVVGTTPSWFSATGRGEAKVDGLNTSRFPVVKVSHKDAVTLCVKLSAR